MNLALSNTLFSLTGIVNWSWKSKKNNGEGKDNKKISDKLFDSLSDWN